MFDHLHFGWVWEQLRNPLVLFGFSAQFVFMLRFAVQWFESERRGRSHVPVSFWVLSLAGGLMLLIYATIKQDIVIMTAQALSLLIYVRNLMLIRRRQTRYRALQQQRGATPHGSPQISSDTSAAT